YNPRRAGAGMRGSFSADNPPYGALLSYYVRTAAPSPLTIRISDSSGQAVAHVPAPAQSGISRAAWDLRADPPPQPAGRGGRSGAAGGEDEEGGGGRGGAQRGRPVAPGEYRAQLGRRSGETFTPMGEVQRVRVRALFTPPDSVRSQ
ncbi:MAG: hypothetical protein ACREMA_05845, partial [Longimicrobiales bacterium]